MSKISMAALVLTFAVPQISASSPLLDRTNPIPWPNPMDTVGVREGEATVFSVPHIVETAHLEDPIIARSMATRQSPDLNVAAKAPRGRGMVLPEPDFLGIVNGERTAENLALRNEMMLELKLAFIQSWQNLGLFGFLGSYAATVGGYYSLGGEDLLKISVPVVGPFLLLEPPQRGVPHSPLPFRQLLLVGSGVVQAGFLADYVISTVREKNLKKKYRIQVQPTSNG
ncbi:MAG: hypothetical protein ACE5HZ_09700, partial [Fidelibacterota bacterium]